MVQTRKTRCIARMDYDTRAELVQGVARMRFLVMMATLHGCDESSFRMKRYRTRRGWHVELYQSGRGRALRLSSAQTVALQAILGSDYRREAFNLFRAMRLSRAPGFWRKLPHWNVLHKERLV